MSAATNTLDAARVEPNAQRRQQLINATIRVMAEYGLSKTTVARVAQAADLSAGIVSFYFRGKDELLLATLEHLDREFRAALQAALSSSGNDPAGALLALIDVYFDAELADARKVAVWFAFWGESRAREDYLRICGTADREFDETVRALVSALPGIDTQAVTAHSAALVGMLDSLWQDILWEGDVFDRAGAVTLCRDFLRSIAPGAFIDVAVRITLDRVLEKQTLPPWTYSNTAFFELEEEHIFKRHWLLVGHSSEMPEVGDYLTFDVAGERALVVRGEDGEIRAFHNVCRHRGSCLVNERQGRCDRLIVCPFHGWTYALNGELRGVPAKKTFPGLDQATDGLVPIEFEVWHGFVFIRFGGDGPRIVEAAAPIAEEIGAYRLEELQPLASCHWEVKPVNWKLIHDVDNEGYHVPIGHPSLQTLYGKDYRDVEVSDLVSASYATVEHDSPYWSVGKYQKLLPEFAHLPADRQRVWAYYGLFPNLVIALYPDMVEYYQTIPVSVDKTVLRGRRFGLRDPRREVRAARYLNVRINDEVSQEDEAYFTWLRDAMRSSVFPRDRLSSLEAGVVGFHQRIKQALPIARSESEPSTTQIRASIR